MKPEKAIEILQDRLDTAARYAGWTGGAYYEALRTAIRALEMARRVDAAVGREDEDDD